MSQVTLTTSPHSMPMRVMITYKLVMVWVSLLQTSVFFFFFYLLIYLSLSQKYYMSPNSPKITLAYLNYYVITLTSFFLSI